MRADAGSDDESTLSLHRAGELPNRDAGITSVRTWQGFTALDRQLADLLTRTTQAVDVSLWVTVALLSRGLRQGDVCLDLEAMAGRSLAELARDEGQDGDTERFADCRLPASAAWRAELRSSALVRTIDTSPNAGRVASGAADDAIGDAEASDLRARPLVLVGRRLYLQRYYQHESVLAERLRARLRSVAEPFGEIALQCAIERWFAGSSEQAKRAAHIAATRRLCIITGGPGTGKTSTVVRLLGLLSELTQQECLRQLRVTLLAPTGKAASRLAESIASAKHQLASLSSAVADLPTTASTLHREVLACRRLPNGMRAPLAVDLLVVDETSMVDLAMMRRLLDVAVNVERVILLGDPNQLASVQAGAVLGEICAPEPVASSSAAGGNAAEGRSLQRHVIELTHSYRFSGSGGIGQLATLIRSGDSVGARSLLASGDNELDFVEFTGQVLTPIIDRVMHGYQPFLAATDPREALDRLGHFRLLCAHRHGRYGVVTINEHIQRRAEQLRRRAASSPYVEPILVTVNSRDTALSNGDLGVLWHTQDRTRAWFRTADERFAEVGVSRLPAFELAYAMSIHKSQGSEMDAVLILLPDVGSPLLTRELLYTAVTRARRHCTIVGSREALARAIEHRVERRSGLSGALQAQATPPTNITSLTSREHAPAAAGPERRSGSEWRDE